MGLLIKIFTLLCLMFTTAVNSKNNDEFASIRVVGETLPPYTLSDGTGQQFDVVHAILTSMGANLDISTYPYKRAVALVESGKADMMVGMLKDEQYDLQYSELPHDVDVLLAIFSKANISKWQNVSSLQNKHITFIAGLSKPFKRYLPAMDFSMSEVDTRKQAVNKLLHGRTDYIVDSEGSFFTSYQRNTVSQGGNLTNKPVGYLQIHAAFSMSERGSKLKAHWDKTFCRFIRSEKAKNIYKKWQLMREYRISQQYFRDFCL
ncbi:substrate-binding periplasmic protein [Thalassotalea sediminis]|uniref:substrate-binding periplasmic protein n=1 Tax=Thalassotalea sediminis TaxID=1759089 RepID=UPI002573516A|nr:transporter substrate-binding domain-containing protein [Thalassotalea sediminis]